MRQWGSERGIKVPHTHAENSLFQSNKVTNKVEKLDKKRSWARTASVMKSRIRDLATSSY